MSENEITLILQRFDHMAEQNAKDHALVVSKIERLDTDVSELKVGMAKITSELDTLGSSAENRRNDVYALHAKIDANTKDINDLGNSMRDRIEAIKPDEHTLEHIRQHDNKIAEHETALARFKGTAGAVNWIVIALIPALWAVYEFILSK